MPTHDDTDAIPLHHARAGAATGIGSFATLVPGNPGERTPWSGHAEPVAEPGTEPVAGRWLSYSGWIGEQAGADEGQFTASFETWGPRGREAFSVLIDRARAELAPRRQTWCLRPHARHLLPDPQQCLNLVRAEEGKGARVIELVLEPTAFLTPDMLPAAEDHLARAIEALGDRAELAGLIATNVRRVETPGGGAELVPAPVDQGELAEGCMAAMVGALRELAARRGLPLFTPRG